MNSPAAALTWELWHRHQKRLMIMAATLLGFALFYPMLCAKMGVSLDDGNALDSLANAIRPASSLGASLQRVISGMLVLFLACGPYGAMIMSLLYLIWMFTFTSSEADPQNPLNFSTRLFTLPVSMTAVALGLMLGGVVMVSGVFMAWMHFVHMPRLDIFYWHTHCLHWVTLLLLTQAVVWTLNGFPLARVAVLCGTFFIFLVRPDLFLGDNQKSFLLVLSVMSCGMGVIGLNKIRHGSWQRFSERSQARTTVKQSEPIEAKPFASAAHAQLWFEWRQHVSHMPTYAVALVVIPFLLLLAYMAKNGPLKQDNPYLLCMYLLGVPLMLHFFYGMAAERAMSPFQAIRPLTTGQMMTANLKALAISTLLTWLIVLPFLLAVPLMGKVDVMRQLHVPTAYQPLLLSLRPVILLVLVMLTWRLSLMNIGHGMATKHWLAQVPMATEYFTGIAGLMMLYFGQSPALRETIGQVLPWVLVVLLAIKFSFAQWAFRTALKRQLLTHATVGKYLVLWGVAGAVLLVPTMIFLRQERWVVSLMLAMILYLPLARIGCAPIALSLGRHR